jgi:type II secretory pathway component PulL
MEERNEANMRELSRIAANVENLKDKFDDKFKHLEGHIEDRVVRIDERLSDKIDTVSDKLHQRINVLAGEHDKTDRLVHKWIYWGGGAWFVFAGLVYLFGTMPIDALKSEWNKMQNKISASEMIVSGVERRLDRLESRK